MSTFRRNTAKVNFAASPYAVQETDDVIDLDTSGGAITLTLPAAPLDGDEIVIKDTSGNAGVNNITIAGNGLNIDGAGSRVLNVNLAKAWIQFDIVFNTWVSLI